MARRNVFKHRSEGLKIDAWHVNEGKEIEVHAKAKCGSCGTENIHYNLQPREPLVAEIENRQKIVSPNWNAETLVDQNSQSSKPDNPIAVSSGSMYFAETFVPQEFRKLQEQQTKSELEDQRRQAENEAMNAFLKLAGGLIVLDWFFNELSR